MGARAGRAPFLVHTTLLLLITATTTSACLWCVQVDESPAPPPDKVPPFSRGATRDISLLPYQIIGVIGAYVGIILIIGTLLLTLGRSMRKRAHYQSDVTQQEMIKPIYKAFDPSPISPGSNRGWNKLRSKRSVASSVHSAGSTYGASPDLKSAASFDNSVIEADRARMQNEMEKLYAAVMQQDGSKPGSGHPDVLPAPPDPPAYVGAGLPTSETYKPYLYPPEATPASPRSPVRAIYPPERGFHDQEQDHRSSEHARVSSLGSSRSIRSDSSSKKLRKSLRNLTISPPMQRRHTGGDDDDELRTPLSPRAYIDPGTPPEPPGLHDTSAPPETPATERMFPLYSNEEGDYQDDDREQLDEIRDLPLASPQRVGAHASNLSRPRVVTNFSKPVPPATSASSSTRTLPLRELNRQYAQQQQQAQYSSRNLSSLSAGLLPSAGGTGMGYLTSAGPVKTTFLEARRDRLGVTGAGGAYLNTPRTGAATPYSPYMPYTPMTPITPHLTSRAERKQRAKEERGAMGAVMEEDAVADDDELWDLGY